MKKATLKLAADLQPGDVWRTVFPPMPRQYAEREPLDPPIEQRFIVLRRKPPVPGASAPTFVFARLDAPTGMHMPEQLLSTRTFNGDDSIEVELPELTPAQTHADRLLGYAVDYLRLVESGDAGAVLSEGDYAELRDLVAELRPPEPPQAPTYAEVLYALQLVTEQANVPGLSGQKEVAADVLKRARAAGVYE